MNNAKEKAQELVKRFYHGVPLLKEEAIACALICCDEIISEIENMDELHDIGYLRFWNDVKTEIKNL